MHWLIETLRAHPEIALFLTLALGYGLTKLRLGPIQLNAVVAVLLAGVAVGQLQIEVPAALQWVFFVLFLFSIGYQTGPQFFRGLGRSALPQVGLALLLCGTVLASALALSKVFGFDAGAGAGLLAGGMNASAAIGTAGDAIARLPAATRRDPDPVHQPRGGLRRHLPGRPAHRDLHPHHRGALADARGPRRRVQEARGGDGRRGGRRRRPPPATRASCCAPTPSPPASRAGRSRRWSVRLPLPASSSKPPDPGGHHRSRARHGPSHGPGPRALRTACHACRPRQSAGRHRGRRPRAAGHPHRHRRRGGRGERR